MSQYGKTWWGKRWLRSLELLGLTYPNSKLPKARNLNRNNAVDLLHVETGEISAWVDEPRKSFGVSITIPAYSPSQWDAISQTLAAKLHNLAELTDDRLPQGIDRQLTDIALPLFPVAGEITANCVCPDRQPACVHVIATQHAFAGRFDDDPFLLPLLRGRDRDELIAGIIDTKPASPMTNLAVKTETVDNLDIDTFYEASGSIQALLLQSEATLKTSAKPDH